MRIIENYDNIPLETVMGDDWDLIVLNKKVDREKLLDWYNTIESTLIENKCNLHVNRELLKGYDKYYTGKERDYEYDTNAGPLRYLNSYQITWPAQRTGPLPPPWACNIELFPELKQYVDDNNEINKDIDYVNWVYLNQYIFGEFKNILEDFGYKYFRNVRIAQHLNGCELPVHTDGYVVRMHIPITTDDSYFYWGENKERQYKLLPGNIYIINTKLPHSTSNHGPVRANIIFDLDPDDIMEFICLK
jgi:hypothetical protein